MLYTYSEIFSFYLYRQAKLISKCLTPTTDERQVRVHVYTYTPGNGNTLESPHWWNFFLAERFKQLHKNDFICLQDI